MSEKQLLIKEIESLPNKFVTEVYKYISFLKYSDKKIDDITLISENALAKEWLLPEEDEVWADL
ncbi:MAG: DUF2281 domain-containing protein [Defluviitaleaceae bacterium]|nr:DUF2281 domain-containing protein [Defluviitaleaceae bacterium]